MGGAFAAERPVAAWRASVEHPEEVKAGSTGRQRIQLAGMNFIWYIAPLKVQRRGGAEETENPADFLPHDGGERTRQGVAERAG